MAPADRSPTRHKGTIEPGFADSNIDTWAGFKFLKDEFAMFGGFENNGQRRREGSGSPLASTWVHSR